MGKQKFFILGLMAVLVIVIVLMGSRVKQETPVTPEETAGLPSRPPPPPPPVSEEELLTIDPFEPNPENEELGELV